MNPFCAAFRPCRIVVAGASFLAATVAFGLDSGGRDVLTVHVFSDRYVAAGRAFSDVAALEAWTKSSPTRVLRLDGCAGSTKRLLAAVERFHAAYPAGIEIHAPGPGEPACALAGEQTSSGAHPPKPSAAEENYLATDEFGRSNIP